MMPQAGVIRLVPKTCVDSIYGEVQDDDCPHFTKLTNMVPAPDSPTMWVPRPGFAGLSGTGAGSPFFYTAYVVFNNYAYGMRNDPAGSGNDIPFAYNLLAQTFTTISGINTATNCPTSPGTGSWQPPHCEVIGGYVIITHSGFTGANGYFGAINIQNPSAPAWTSQNTTTNALPSPPVWVTQFNNRAYYFVTPGGAVPPAAYCSDNFANGGPLSRSAAVAGVIITFGDNAPVLCAATQSVSNLAGGVVSALYVFKDASKGSPNIFQITGDSAFSAGAGGLTLQPLNCGVSTTAPNSVVSTPKGIMFMAPDGIRLINQQGSVSDPIGWGGSGITMPFINCAQPTRVAAACNGVVYRICSQNGAVSGGPNQDWCFDLTRGIWYGPHDPGFGLVAVWGTTFVVAALPTGGNYIGSGLSTSSLVPSATSTYLDVGTQTYSCQYVSTMVPDRKEINQLSSVKVISYLGYGAGSTDFTFHFLDVNGNIIGSADLPVNGSAGPQWGTFVWGSNQPLFVTSNLAPFDVPIRAPVVFDRLKFVIVFSAAAGIRVGITYISYEQTGYTERL